MHLLLLNGSPKGESGNSNYLLHLFAQGFDETPGNTREFADLANGVEQGRLVESFVAADAVVFAFPLYTDMMPGLVKAFIDALEAQCGREGNPALGFIIQCGFPESVHLRTLETYLEKLSRRLGCRYLGTALRGGGENLRTGPASVTRPIVEGMRSLGRSFGKTGEFDRGIIRRFSGTEKMPPPQSLFMRVLGNRLIDELFWHRQMRQNGSYERRLARPYAEPPPGW
ncbi:MAG: NAD(P)H-dependent oxidoreductase [Dehalococcoidia bacterium]|nr:NAD(P)H-dependent oxidoreductase [Dehalococcoidia bacterium]